MLQMWGAFSSACGGRHFPKAGLGGKCDRAYFSGSRMRVKQVIFCLALWATIWLLGSWGLDLFFNLSLAAVHGGL